MTSTQDRTDSDSTRASPSENPASTLEEHLRTALAGLTATADAVLDLLIVDAHRSAAPQVYDVPVSTDLAAQLLEQVVDTATSAAEAELRQLEAGFTSGPQQWVHGPIPDGLLADLDSVVLRRTHRQYDRDAEFGARNLLVLRVRSGDGTDLGRVYQGFSAEKALAKGKRIVAFWNGERFASLDAQPLVIDRSLRLFTFGDHGGTPAPAMVMKSNNAYESLFGALPDLKVQAAETFTATLGKLPIVGGEELRAACESDLNMMRKLLSIKHRMEQPGYPDAVDMPSVVAFLERNPHVNVPIETSDGSPTLVFRPQAQQRWALLKLLDDDFLRSDLTNINYEANSKTEVAG